jgi:hypothetical protein
MDGVAEANVFEANGHAYECCLIFLSCRLFFYFLSRRYFVLWLSLCTTYVLSLNDNCQQSISAAICLLCYRIVIFSKPGTIIYIPSTVRIVYISPVLVFLMDVFFALVPIFILVGFPYGIYKTEVINHSLSNRTYSLHLIKRFADYLSSTMAVVSRSFVLSVILQRLYKILLGVYVANHWSREYVRLDNEWFITSVL